MKIVRHRDFISIRWYLYHRKQQGIWTNHFGWWLECCPQYRAWFLCYHLETPVIALRATSPPNIVSIISRPWAVTNSSFYPNRIPTSINQKYEQTSSVYTACFLYRWSFGIRFLIRERLRETFETHIVTFSWTSCAVISIHCSTVRPSQFQAYPLHKLSSVTNRRTRLVLL